ncbi:MAG: MerR family transcriptional regulator [Antricoccus sp.]
MWTTGEFARLGQPSPRMLRHDDEGPLLSPAHMDAHTDYRFYAIAQLGRLHRLVALHDLGFTSEQVRPFLDQARPTEQLRGMLKMRKAQIAQNLCI